MRWLDGITDSMAMNLSKLQKMVKGREAWRAAVPGAAKSRTQLSNGTALSSMSLELLYFESLFGAYAFGLLWLHIYHYAMFLFISDSIALSKLA